jgi:glucose 1-dehydrogenase
MRVLVTGASRGGIGGAICRRLVGDIACQHKQAAIAISATGTDRWLKADLHRAGIAVYAIPGNLLSPEFPERLVHDAAQLCGGLDLVVSCAGRSGRGALSDISLADWDEMLNLHARAAWLLAKAAYPHLKQSQGSFIAIGSITSREPLADSGAYPVAKAALAALCQSLAVEWAPDGVRVNVISPGLISTAAKQKPYAGDITPLGRAGLPEDVAGAVAFLASTDAAYITGADIVVDGGFSRSGLGRIQEARRQYAT